MPFREWSRLEERVAMMGANREMLPFQDRYARDRMRDAFVEGHRAGARQAWEAAEGEGPLRSCTWRA